MAKKRFLSEQIVAILREAEKAPSVEEVLRKHGISEQTYYRWKRMYGSLGVSEVHRIKQLEEENRKLKQLAGDQALAIQVLQEHIKKRGTDRRAKRHGGSFEGSGGAGKTGLRGTWGKPIQLPV